MDHKELVLELLTVWRKRKHLRERDREREDIGVSGVSVVCECVVTICVLLFRDSHKICGERTCEIWASSCHVTTILPPTVVTALSINLWWLSQISMKSLSLSETNGGSASRMCVGTVFICCKFSKVHDCKEI